MKRLAFIFLEPSTRTFASFWMAARELGIDVCDIRDSSIAKGESLEDTVRTVEQIGFDGIVLRTPFDDGWKRARAVTDIPVIDAGNGKFTHTSQVLGDCTTLVYAGFKLSSVKVAFLGDTENSRVYNQFKWMVPKHVVCTAKEAIGADVYYCLRPQTERGYDSDNLPFYVYPEMMYTGAYLMHPGPYTGVEFHKNLLNHDRNLMGEQVKNGLDIRKKLLRGCLGSS